MKSFWILPFILILCSLEILRVYFIMPFPGSQKLDVVHLAYWLDQNIYWLRILILLLIAIPTVNSLRATEGWKRALSILLVAAYGIVFYFFNFRFLAEKMFYQPKQINFTKVSSNKIPMDKLILGIDINGESKAYPIQLIGYHHQVRDTVGGVPVMVTYCTVCRTGRIFNPLVKGKPETFRLVGMDHFNAMFEDASTKSWWRQVSGEAIAGPLRGTMLEEIPSRQMTLASWLSLYPESMILQPDSAFQSEYDDLEGYDKGKLKSKLEKRDSLSWKQKSWIVGIQLDKTTKAYDWNELLAKKLIEDSLAGTPIILLVEKDSASFHSLSRWVENKSLHFVLDTSRIKMTDRETGSVWSLSGQCLAGPLSGTTLKPIRSSQEFWHSWKEFNPNTLKY